MDLRLEVLPHGGQPISVRSEPSALVIAGWAGRDLGRMEEHIRELEALGVRRPETMPTFYPLSPARLTQAADVVCLGSNSSGEAEVVFLAEGSQIYVGIGSDHTDRRIEAYDITVSKQVCDKPVGRQFWSFHDVEGHWDELTLSSEIEEGGSWTTYQAGTVADLLSPHALFAKLNADARLDDGTALFGGTLPAIGGVRAAERFRAKLVDPVLGRALSVEYRTHVLPWDPPEPTDGR